MNKILKSVTEIKQWLNFHEIKNYTLISDKDYGFVVDVLGDVDLTSKNLEHIAVKFNHIQGSFDCYDNKLNSLEGCPDRVDDDFYCSSNNLTSLMFCPSYVGRNFSCNHNSIKSLEFCSSIVNGEFECSNNQIDSLEFFPSHVGEGFYCFDNKKLQDFHGIINFDRLYQEHLKAKVIAAKNNLEKKLKIYGHEDSPKTKI